MTLPACWVVELGEVEYPEAERLQLELVRARRAGEVPDVLLLLEHPPVVTVGRSAASLDQFVDLEGLERLGIPVCETSRGGQVTYHGPGQIVGYPILDLRALKPDLHWYLRSLEQMLIDSLAIFRYEAERIEGLTGVWVTGRKVASIGIAVRHWVSYHGFALNVSHRSRAWSHLRPCGLAAEQIGSLQELGPPLPSPASLRRVIAEQFGRAFQRAVQPNSCEELFTQALF